MNNWNGRMHVLLVSLALTCGGGAGTALGQDTEETNEFLPPRAEFYKDGDSSQERREARSRNLLQDLGNDFKNLFTRRDNVFVIAGAAGATWGARELDQSVATSGLNSELNGGTALDSFFEAGEVGGGSAVQVGAAFATYGLGKLFDGPGLEDLGRDLVRAQLVTGAITFGMKNSFRRLRPDGSSARSFPSGHTSGTFATATVLQRRYGWKAGIPAYAAAGYVAASRLNENRHFLSDVIFGAALGIVVGRTVTMELGGERFALGAMIVPEGAGVQLAWVPSAR